MTDDVRTCSESLLRVGRCCDGECPEDATWAVLDEGYVEHLRCDAHSVGDEILGRKPWRWAAGWGPPRDELAEMIETAGRRRLWAIRLPTEYLLTVAVTRVPFWLFLAWRHGVDHRQLTPPEETP